MGMNHSAVCKAWAGHRAGSSSNLNSDSTSLWSYGWYEIARHVGDKLAFVRHDSESYSRSTQRHMRHMYAAIYGSGITALQAGSYRNDTGYGTSGEMGQPDWDWLKWALWFNEKYSGWRDRVFVRVIPGFKFRGDSVLTQACKLQCSVPLMSLVPSMAGVGVLTFPYESMISNVGLKGGIHITQRDNSPRRSVDRRIYLIKLMRVDPTTPLSQVMAMPLRKNLPGPSWQILLFPGEDPFDLRTQMKFDERAFKHGEPKLAG